MQFNKMQWLWMFVVVASVLEVTGGNAKHKRGRGSMWWGIAKVGEPDNLRPIAPGGAHVNKTMLKMLRRRQLQLATDNPGVLMAVIKGANQAIQECQYQFRNRQWNCSVNNYEKRKNLFGKIVDKGCRETAFIYAITSAAVTYTVARACAEGSIESCTCDYSHQVRAPAASQGSAAAGVRDWEWGGCSDNIGYGFRFSRAFVDAGERGRNLREKMNLHNNEAGRAHVQTEMRQECKCHGMSGSCTVKTCWMRLPNFRAIGDHLKDRFDGASKVMVSNSLRPNEGGPGPRPNTNTASFNTIRSNGPGLSTKKKRYNFQLKPHNPGHKPPGLKDLVYLEESPKFCSKNPKLGIEGTHGRQCNDTSQGVDGCNLMCCGRGYKTEEQTVMERCSCTFHWCCEVKCKLCKTKKTVHTCL
ncbi:wnt family member 1 wingless [Arctopsyche grandis]|uniref:wnt family member 1 wingless n=1 Tax=Arctopsyche grandis TaxID=121162 RepID=UPI00406D6A8F